ncbi:hypothetical protein WJX73_006952 [Symbiochloris irregularis]|uniref:Uncharacterized protein n=1 Tax=Symbiochloris irregularis TaxID=706552 RepID=A0AAW1PVQ8_9CHLO
MVLSAGLRAGGNRSCFLGSGHQLQLLSLPCCVNRRTRRYAELRCKALVRGFLPDRPNRTRTPEEVDIGKEESRRYRRTVFTFDDWAAHRSASRYGRHLKDVFTSRIVRGLATPLLSVMTVASVITVYHLLKDINIVPAEWPSLTLTPGEPFSQTSFALSLLLVFRTNTSFSRWQDARTIWGGMLQKCRDLVRQSMIWVDPELHDMRNMVVRWSIALLYTTKCHLRQDSDIEEDLKGLLTEDEQQELFRAEHQPQFILHVLGELVLAMSANEGQLTMLEQNLVALSDNIGACEMLLKTPIPLSYTRHTSRVLVILVSALPIILWDQCRYATAPVSAIISFLLLGIEEIGVQIEEPFSILPLDNVCETAKEGLFELERQAGRVHGLVMDTTKPVAKTRFKFPLYNSMPPSPSSNNSNQPVEVSS